MFRCKPKTNCELSIKQRQQLITYQADRLDREWPTLRAALSMQRLVQDENRAAVNSPKPQ